MWSPSTRTTTGDRLQVIGPGRFQLAGNSLTSTDQHGHEKRQSVTRKGLPSPALPLFDLVYGTFPGVRSVKFCARTAHTRVTEKYDGGAAHTASERTWEAA